MRAARSYGAGLARAAAAAGLMVLKCEQPTRKTRRGQGKSDPIDAHLAVLSALQLDVDRLPTPRPDGHREALRILLCARQELTTTATAQTNRLRALLRDGDDTDRRLAHASLSDAVLAGLARRRQPREASREQAIRHGEIRRLALALREASRTLKANRAELHAIVNRHTPRWTVGSGGDALEAEPLVFRGVQQPLGRRQLRAVRAHCGHRKYGCARHATHSEHPQVASRARDAHHP